MESYEDAFKNYATISATADAQGFLLGIERNRKNAKLFLCFFEKFFKKNHENSKNYQNGFLRKIAAKIVKNSKNSKKSFENRIMIFVFNYFNFFCYKMLK